MCNLYNKNCPTICRCIKYSIMKKILRVSTVPISLNSLLKGQLKMLSENYEVVGVSSPGKELEEVQQREGVRIISLPMKRHISLGNDFISLMRMIYILIRERPAMIHSITPKAGLISMLGGWITRVPVRMHTFTGLLFPTAIGLKKKLLIWMDRLTCACATHINPEGNGVKQDLINYRITKKTLKIIANGNVNGIDLDYFRCTPEVMKKADEYRKGETFTFCFIGRMVRDKGLNELIAAFVQLYEKYRHVRLLLVGPFEQNLDPIKQDVAELIRHHEAILFMGFQKDVRPFLAASDAFVFPSYREGFPNVVLQAGAMGLASIVTNINGSNEIIIQDINGCIIPPRSERILYEVMEYFVTHPSIVQDMGKHARNLVLKRYDQKLVWKALLKEYNEILGE